MSERLAARRTVLAAAGATGLTATLAACGGSETSDSGSGAASDSTVSTGDTPDAAQSPEGGQEKGTELASASEIPVGGGTIFKDQKVVVTQPTSGDYKAFSSDCTHRGCAVSEVKDGTINCLCHNSKFSITDGSVQGGPATKPLPTAEISVDGDTIRAV